MNIFFSKLNFSHFSFTCCLVLIAGILSSCDPLGNDLPRLTNDKGFEVSTSEKKAPLVSFSSGTAIEGQYIVVFKENAIINNEMSRIAETNIDRSMVKEAIARNEKYTASFKSAVNIELQKHKIATTQIKKTISSKGMQAVVLTLDHKKLENIRLDSKVAYVEQDRFYAMSFLDPVTRSPMIPSTEDLSVTQVSPYGVARVGGCVKQKGNASWAWIVDTGIDMDHQDLKVNTGFSKNFVPAEVAANYSGNDSYGHGTHVAGIIGAKDNRGGVMGVAAGAQLVSIKVIDDAGVGTVSDLLDGLAWIEMNAMAGDVVNLSLGGSISVSIDDAVKEIAQKGVYVVIAAGNDSKDASLVSPARVNEPNVFTISAVDEFDNYCIFSNYGSGVDFAAPGANILSTFIDDQYAYASGTSMAAPHAAGVLLITSSPLNGGGVIGDPDGTTDQVIEH